jgi:hypothetical protein
MQGGMTGQPIHGLDGCLAAELTKAETALRLNLCYEQDQPLRQN